MKKILLASSLTLIFSVMLFLLYDPKVEAEMALSAPTGATTDTLPTAFTHNDTLFFVWRGLTNANLYYAYLQGGAWSAIQQVTDINGAVLNSGYGVEAVTFRENSGKDTVCLFFKASNGNENEGAIDYSCSFLEQDELGKPVLEWQSPNRFTPQSIPNNMNLNKVDSVPSIRVFTDGKLHMVAGVYKNSDYHLLEFTCDLNAIDANFSLNNACTFASEELDKARGASVAQIKNNYLNHALFFFRQDSELFYVSTEQGKSYTGSKTKLKDTSYKIYKTSKRTSAAAAFHSNVYLAFADNDRAINIAKVAENDTTGWVITKNHGDGIALGKWTVCSMTDKKGSKSDPSLFVYQNGLYVLYSDGNSNLVYQPVC